MILHKYLLNDTLRDTLKDTLKGSLWSNFKAGEGASEGEAYFPISSCTSKIITLRILDVQEEAGNRVLEWHDGKVDKTRQDKTKQDNSRQEDKTREDKSS